MKCLAFVPSNEVLDYYNEFYNHLEDADSKSLTKWFFENYVDEKSRQYSPEFWSVFESTANTECFPRTQNSVEAWHRRLRVVVGKKNAGLYKIINDLGRELVMAKHQIEKAANGDYISKKRKYVLRNRRIRAILRRREDTDMCDYLHRLAHFTDLG